MSRTSLLQLILLLVIISGSTQKSTIKASEARPLPFIPQEKYSKLFATLGLACKCCDEDKGSECASSWTGSCRDLRCLPWKMDH